MNTLSKSYDEVSYPVYARPQTHPDRLATLATLFGMRPAPVERCRVLELGGGEGGNLIAMAFGLAESEFVGLELSPVAVARGREMVEALGLKNVTLREFDLMDASPALGRFDYIIAHGVYSWVPTAVSEKILDLCRMCLAPDGVAYISYNTYPGTQLRVMLREMMQFHIRGFDMAREQITQARALLEFLIEAQTKRNEYGDFLRQEKRRFSDYADAHLYHDDLESEYHPFLFDEFVAQTAAHDLQFLTEAEFSEANEDVFTPHARRALERIARDGFERKEQYADFLKCRSFRQSLLCRASAQRDDAPKPERVRGLRIAAGTRLARATPEQIRAEASAPMDDAPGKDALGKAAISFLRERWPRSSSFDDLLLEMQSRAGRDEAGSEDARALSSDLCETILQAYAAGLVELRSHEPRFTLEVSARPRASQLARVQIERGSTVITNLRHDNVQMEDELARRLILLMDGERDHAQLATDLAALVETDGVVMEEDGAQIKDRERARELLTDALEGKLDELARLSLLVA